MRFAPIARATALAVTIAVGATALAPHGAQAQTTTPEAENIDATPKGTIGLGLIGAEVGFVIPALAGLHDWYWFVVFPTIGAAGGAVGGYFAFDNNDREKWSVAMLTTGIALVLPTMVLTLSQTAYDPSEEPSTIPVEGGGGGPAVPPGMTERRERLEDVRRAGSGLIRRSDRGWLMSAPGVSLAATYTARERLLLGVEPTTEVRVPLLTGVF